MSDRGDDDALRVAVIGYGLGGRVFHAPLVTAADGLELTQVVTGNPERQAEVRERYPDAVVVPSADELFEDPDAFDVVVVTTANDAHLPLATRAAVAGKAVVVDKPIALSSADATALVEVAEAEGVLLTVFQNRRWDSDQLTLRRLLAEGQLGDVLRYESRFERWRPEHNPRSWRESQPSAEGGGLLLDLGSHLVDQALTLFGPARRVYAEIDVRRGGSDDDVFIALEHDAGERSHLWAGALAGSPGPRLRVLGSRGAYVVDGLDSQEDTLRDTGSLPPGGHPEPPASYGRVVRGPDVMTVPSEPGRWDLYYSAVAAAVRGDGPVPVDARSAVEALVVIEAARRSAADHVVVGL